MATSDKSSARFRSATEFPKKIDHISSSEVSALYQEMRDCLIFTNRSRAQLIRRNEEHKQTALKLRTDIDRLQGMIGQLKLEKTQLAEGNQQIITALEREMSSMAGHLDQLSAAFDTVGDLDNPTQAQWSFLAFPSRFITFLRSIKAIVSWWREEKGEEPQAIEANVTSQSRLPDGTEEDRRNSPQMYTDQASQGRSLLDK